MIQTMSLADIERFKTFYFEGDSDQCWLWQGHEKNTGYGQFWIDGRNFYPHHIAYFLYYGRLDSELKVLHQCDVRLCVNPLHLIQGTQAENIQDAVSKMRHCHGETHGMVELTEAQVLEIREMYANYSYTYKEIGAMYGVSKEHIHRIVKRKSWKHI